MFSCIKGQNRLIYFIGAFINKNQRLINAKKPSDFYKSHTLQFRLYKVMCSEINSTNLLITGYESRLPIIRYKSKSKKASPKKRVEYESSDDEDDIDDNEGMELEDEINDFGEDAEVITRNVKSVRTDSVLKSTLNISRKKVEDYFYHNRIRVNGKLLYKKSQNVKIGDEIDIIYNVENFQLNTLKVGRIKILNAKEDPDNDRVTLKVLRFKSLVIDNTTYEDEWREPKDD